ncbi:casein kinase I-like isoform X3 [Sitodiplosis mosellana]|uniref:casein kinase I-like isoform X3 n=1 Tax=Sitodiplosis mosellana TaxID=263140 RepID=UPI002443A3CC|nr:casein kinase I-like isoform X3 [Sitodiplosis mosellana]
MIRAFVQQILICIVLIHFYSYWWFDEYETSLAVVNELKLIIPKEHLSNVVIDDRFLVQELLGDGYTGFVRSGIDLKTGEEVAIKFAEEDRYFSLEKEYVNYLYLGADDPDVVQHGIPHIIHFGDFGGFKVLVMTKTGPNLYDLAYETDDEKFTFSTICKIAIQSIRIFEYIHSKGLLFHDVKPTNIAVGRTNADQIFFYDFAFSEFYVNAMGEPKAREKATELNGTPEYMGRGPLNRNTHVRKDDFISFGLVLLHLNGVRLPWMNLTNEFEDIYQTMDIVLEQWAKYGIYAICNESDSPNFFVKYFDYFDTLKSHERPDYDFLVQLFENELTAEELANKNWNDCEIKHTNDTDNFEKFDSDDNNKETSLTVVNELKWTIPEKYIHGVVIDDRFIVGKHLGHGYTGFVRSGLDTKTGTEVAIKFAAEDKFHYLENEFVNYLYLGADDPDIVQHGVPYIVHFGDFLDYKILVMTKAGPSLFELRNRTKAGKIELKWLCKIAIQAVGRT